METGSIEGKVTDNQGSPLVAVPVTVSGTYIPGSWSTITSKTGEYTFKNVPAGLCSIVAVYPEFKAARDPRVQVEAGEPTIVNLEMIPDTR